MKKKYSPIWFGAVILILAILYSLILFSVKHDMTEAHWLLYGFTLLAFLCAGAVCWITIKSKSNIVFDVPIIVVTTIYTGIQLIICGILLMLFRGIPFALACTVEFVLLGIYLIIVFSLVGTEKAASAQNDKDQAAVRQSRMTESKILTLADEAENEDVKKKLRALAEKVHYSDVSNGPEVAEIDERINRNLYELEEDLADRDIDVTKRIEKISHMFDERNRIVAINR